ncbi:efflux RND transporter periplasmic adaptor subunit [Pseudomonas aeruginosa]|nr:efflux RND transporter periplasmic adaptor subunit [Pseudomonas aeruginosa]
MNRKILAGVAIAVVGVVGVSAWLWSGNSSQKNDITLLGNVDIRQVSLAFQDSERIVEMRVEEGAKVTAGQVLAVLDTRTLELQAAQTEAQIEVNKKALLRLRNGSRPEEIGQAAAQLKASEESLALLRHRISLAELKAPTNAVVRSRLAEPGDMASPQKPVYALAIVQPKWIRAYVNEAQLARVRPGMSAEVKIDGLPDASIAGEVGYISSVAEFTPKPVQTEELRTSLVYEVRVLVKDPDDQLRLGMPATVRLVP